MDKSLDEARVTLKEKKILFAFWRAESKRDAPYGNWYLPLKKIFGEVSIFDPAKIYFKYGSKKMNQLFLQKIDKERPDYIFFAILYDEFLPNYLISLKERFPEIPLFNLFSDDNWRYDNFSKYYASFFDSTIILHDYRKEYKKETNSKAHFLIGVNCDLFKPIYLKKKYSVGFFGRSNKNRLGLVRYLIRNGIEIKVWGEGWEKYPDLKRHCSSSLETEDLVKVINETKINLGFTMGSGGKLQIKGRPFEVSACKSFIINEYFEDYSKFFKKGEIVTFKNKEDLVKKIKYYLTHEKERESIAERAYKRVVKDYNQEIKLLKFFASQDLIVSLKNKILSDNSSVATLKIQELEDIDLIKKKIFGKEYVAIHDEGSIIDSLKIKFQIFSMKATNKPISCCDYYVYSPQLGDYLLFKASQAFLSLPIKTFSTLSIPDQLLFSNEYFLDNLDKIMSYIRKRDIKLFEKENISFVSIPLVRVRNMGKVEYKYFKEAFQLKFLDQIYSKYIQGKLIGKYSYSLFTLALLKNPIIIRAIYENLTDADKIRKLKNGV